MSSTILHTGAGQVSNTGGLGYSFSFATLDRADIQVEVIDPSNTNTVKSVTQDYTIENYLEAGSSNSHIKFVSEAARGFTNSQSDASSYKVRVSRQTSSVPKVNFTAGSSITALDLNTHGKQALHLSEENRDALNALALGDSSSAIQIDSSNIENLTIQAVDIKPDAVETDKIKDLNVTTDKINNLAVTEGKIADNNVTANKLKSSSSTDSDRAVTTNHIRDGAVTDAKLSTISGSKINPNFGSQNISTTGTLNAGTTTTGTTTTGSTTAQDLTVTDNLTLSSGNQDNKGLIFPTNIGGGTGDKAYIRYFVDGTGENTRLKIGNENDGDDDIYLQAGLVQTSGPLTVGGLLTANSFSGIPVQDVKVAWNSSETNFGNNTSWHTHLEVGPFTNVTNSSKFLIVAVYEIKNESSSTSCTTEARITEVNGTLIPNLKNTNVTASYQKFTHIEFDRANNSSNRTYRVQCRSTNSHTSCNAFMDDAFLAVFHLKPS